MVTGYDNARDKERTTVQTGHQNTSQYAKEAELGELMTEMMTTLLLSKPDTPVDFLIDLLSASRSQRIAVCAPPGVKLESVVKAIANDLGVIVVSVPPLIDEAQERYIEGKTVAEHGADGVVVPDRIVAKLVGERLAKADCMEKGWVLERAPTTRQQAQKLIAEGWLPDKVIVLNAQDDVLIKAAVDEDAKAALPASLKLYHKNMAEMLPLFASASEQFDCDGADVSAVLPVIRRALQKKTADPAISAKAQ